MHTFLIICIIFTVFNWIGSFENYGKFEMFMHNAQVCKGPRHKDCATFEAHVLPGGRVLRIYLEVLEDAYMEYIRVAAYKTGAEKNTPPIVSFQLNKPCDQPIIGETFKLWANIQKSCLLKKNKYNYTVDAWMLAQKFWGGTFFYGNYTFKSTFFNNKCNFGCTDISVTYLPKH